MPVIIFFGEENNYSFYIEGRFTVENSIKLVEIPYIMLFPNNWETK